MSEIRITAEPADDAHCTFKVSAPILPSGARRFASAAEAAGSPLAEAIFAVPGVTEVMVSGAAVTVTKADATPWQATGKAVGAAIRAALQSSVPPVAPARRDPAADDAMYDRIAMIFETRINPAVAGHGGHVDLIDVQDGVVMLRMQGGCQGCGMASVTLRQGIEKTLRQIAPDVAGVVDITDHASGASPYYAAESR